MKTETIRDILERWELLEDSDLEQRLQEVTAFGLNCTKCTHLSGSISILEISSALYFEIWDNCLEIDKFDIPYEWEVIFDLTDRLNAINTAENASTLSIEAFLSAATSDEVFSLLSRGYGLTDFSLKTKRLALLKMRERKAEFQQWYNLKAPGLQAYQGDDVELSYVYLEMESADSCEEFFAWRVMFEELYESPYGSCVVIVPSSVFKEAAQRNFEVFESEAQFLGRCLPEDDEEIKSTLRVLAQEMRFTDALKSARALKG